MSNAPDKGYNWIDLDGKTPWWASLVAIFVVAAIVTVLIAPWVISFDEGENTVAASTQQASSSYCRPDSEGLPTFLNPSLASWNRFCEWFIEPNVENNGE